MVSSILNDLRRVVGRLYEFGVSIRPEILPNESSLPSQYLYVSKIVSLQSLDWNLAYYTRLTGFQDPLLDPYLTGPSPTGSLIKVAETDGFVFGIAPTGDSPVYAVDYALPFRYPLPIAPTFPHFVVWQAGLLLASLSDFAKPDTIPDMTEALAYAPDFWGGIVAMFEL